MTRIAVLLMSFTLYQPLFCAEPGASERIESIHALVDEFRDRLGAADRVEVVVEAGHPRLVSLRHSPVDSSIFILTFDRGFLESLDGSELRAAVAHEFGHLWIFTHHPYLHTEQLANRVALKLVSRADLEKVYARMQEKLGEQLDLTDFLGQ